MHSKFQHRRTASEACGHIYIPSPHTASPIFHRCSAYSDSLLENWLVSTCKNSQDATLP